MSITYLTFSIPPEICSDIDIDGLPDETVEDFLADYEHQLFRKAEAAHSYEKDFLDLGSMFRFLFFLLAGERVSFGLPNPQGRPVAHAFFGCHPIGDEIWYLTPEEVRDSSKALGEILGKSKPIWDRYDESASESAREGRPFPERYLETTKTMLERVRAFFRHAAEMSHGVVIEIN